MVDKYKERSTTSLKRSPCLLSSASIALSRIPPDVALAIEWEKRENKSGFGFRGALRALRTK